MQDKKDKKKGKKDKKDKKDKKKGKEPQVQKFKLVRRKRTGPKNRERQAICRAINNSTRPDITRGILTHRVYEQIVDSFEPGKMRNGKLLRRFIITRPVKS